MIRPLRKDAAARRATLLRAAASLFEQDGIDVSLDRIADQAGVGRATLYRNFSGRTAIALAVLTDEFDRLGDSFSNRSDPEAFLDFLTALSVALDRNSALRAVLRSAADPDLFAALRVALIHAATAPLHVSQAAGLVRGDVKPSDVRILAAMLATPMETISPLERAATRRRTLALVLDSVRPHGTEPALGIDHHAA